MNRGALLLRELVADRIAQGRALPSIATALQAMHLRLLGLDREWIDEPAFLPTEASRDAREQRLIVEEAMAIVGCEKNPDRRDVVR